MAFACAQPASALARTLAQQRSSSLPAEMWGLEVDRHSAGWLTDGTRPQSAAVQGERPGAGHPPDEGVPGAPRAWPGPPVWPADGRASAPRRLVSASGCGSLRQAARRHLHAARGLARRRAQGRLGSGRRPRGRPRSQPSLGFRALEPRRLDGARPGRRRRRPHAQAEQDRLERCDRARCHPAGSRPGRRAGRLAQDGGDEHRPDRARLRQLQHAVGPADPDARLLDADPVEDQVVGRQKRVPVRRLPQRLPRPGRQHDEHDAGRALVRHELRGRRRCSQQARQALPQVVTDRVDRGLLGHPAAPTARRLRGDDVGRPGK